MTTFVYSMKLVVWTCILIAIFSSCSTNNKYTARAANDTYYDTQDFVAAFRGVWSDVIHPVNISGGRLRASAEGVPGGGSWVATLEIIHRDHVSSPLRRKGATAQELLVERLKRGAARVEALNRHIDQLTNDELAAAAEHRESEGGEQQQQQFESSSATGSSLTKFSSNIVVPHSSGEYLTVVGMGTPPVQAAYVIDTGSDLTWLQCQPCTDCFDQGSQPIFDPAHSSSFEKVACDSPVCTAIGEKRIFGGHCGWFNRDCPYVIRYADGSSTAGLLAKETLFFDAGTAGRTRVPKISIGCSEASESKSGAFDGATGVLALGGGPFSLPSQLRAPLAFCLPSRLSGDAGRLYFGSGDFAPRRNAVVTQLVRNPKWLVGYYLPLTGISVAGVPLPIPPGTFSIDSHSGRGGVLLDTGAEITHLVDSAYVALRDKIRALTKHIPSAPSAMGLETCYHLESYLQVVLDFPKVHLHFHGGAVLILRVYQVLMPVDSTTFCLAFAPASRTLSVIANNAMQTTLISLNEQTHRAEFTYDYC